MSDIFGEEEAELPKEEVEVEPQPAEEAPKEEAVAKDTTVPLSALNEARAQLRQTQAEMAQMRDQVGSVDNLRQQLDEFRNRDQQVSDEQEFNTDPLGTIQKQVKALDEKFTNQSEESFKAQQTQEYQQQAFSQIAAQVNEFKSKTPDYDDALAHVMETRKQQLMAIGTPEQVANQRIAAEAQEIGINAMQTGMNPGKIVYDLANQMGYKAKQTAKKLEVIEKGQQQSSTLSQSSGDAGETGFSLTEIDNMSDKEFDAFWEKEMKPTNR